MVTRQPAYLHYHGYLRQDGTVAVEAVTNDNNDDGLPDGKTVEWPLEFKSVEEFRNHCGRSRIGISGIKVVVRLNGREVR